MPTFTDLELSRQLGDPVALYYFGYGSASGAYFAYTDANHDITAPGSLGGSNVTYVPKPIIRGNIVQGGTLDRTSMELRAPRDIELAALFEIWPPSQVVICVIRQGHLGETDGLYPAVWSGRVTAVSFEASEVVFALEPVITSLRRTGLRRNYQYGCPHALYSAQCGADKASATVTIAITSANPASNVIVMPAAWYGSIPVGKYITGMVQWVNPDGNIEIRSIIGISGGKDLVIGGFATNLPNSTNVDVSLGCNHRAGFADTDGDCTNLHHEAANPSNPNINNFGGQPWIPLINPVSGVLLYR